MSDCHELFDIKTDFVHVVISRVMMLRGDDDVMLMFHRYRKRPKIGVYIYEAHTPLMIHKDAGGEENVEINGDNIANEQQRGKRGEGNDDKNPNGNEDNVQ